MIDVDIAGEDSLTEWLIRAVDAQRDMRVRTGAEIEVSPRPDGGVTVTAARSGRVARLPSPPACAYRRIAVAFRDVRRASLTVLAPAGLAWEASTGPMDAVALGIGTFDDDDDVPRAPRITLVAVVPHTRCWLIACTIEATSLPSLAEAADRLGSAPRVVVVPAGAGFVETASLGEFFRDVGRPDGEFYETVVFGETLALVGGRIALWIAAHAAAPVPETVDAVRGFARRPVARDDTDESLGVLRTCHLGRRR